jgi:hypothetical protein
MLTCGLNSGSVSTGYYINWFKQIPGQAPYTLTRIWAPCGPYLENALGFLVPGVSLCSYIRALILVENYSEFQML